MTYAEVVRATPVDTPRPTTLYLLCGRIAAGKSTLARRLASRPRTLLIGMDHWMSSLFPVENETMEDFARLTARLRDAMGPHVVDILLARSKGFCADRGATATPGRLAALNPEALMTGPHNSQVALLDPREHRARGAGGYEDRNQGRPRWLRSMRVRARNQ
jgi:hypothetical protein